MSEGADGIQCGAANISGNFNTSEIQNCVKCVEHEFRLQQAMEELKSVQLIVQMLRNEHIHEDHDAAAVQQTGPDLVANDSWKEISKRSYKKHIKGKIELRNLFMNHITTTNQYTALDSEYNISREEFNLETVLVNKTKAISTRQSRNKINTEQESLAISVEQDKSDIRAEEQPNLQNPTLSRKKLKLNVEQVTYSIPTVINRQISRKIASEMVYSSMRDQKRMLRSTYKKTKAVAYKKHKIFMIGDSHIRGLSEKVRNSLNDTFSVIGVTKPNATIEAITSPLHLPIDNLTKSDLNIFYGGTKDISSNESSKGLRCITDFAQRTSNTNVIILGVPHRYDLPHFSCINTEVKLFNNKLQNRMATFNHVNILNIPTGRSQHTTHGSHLNKKGKNLMANNLVKEIKTIYSAQRTASPIVLPWGDVKDQTHKVCDISTLSDTIKDNIDCLNLEKNLEQQVTRGSVEGDPAGGPVTKAPINMANDDDERSVNVNSLLKTVMRCEGETAVGPQEADYVGKIPGLNDKYQEDVIKRKSTRTKKNPAVTNQDFLW